MSISVLIADDQEMVRTGLQHMIGADAGLKVVASADNGRTALALARKLRPDVCVLDIRMPVMTGLEVTKILAADPNPPGIVIVTTYDLEEYLLDALRSGASGFVLKDATAHVLTSAVYAAADGGALISPRLTRRLIKTFVDHHPVAHELVVALTSREVEVLEAVCSGETNGEIARNLNMALSTVKGHVSALMDKTDCRNRVKLVIWAHRHSGMLP